MRNRGQHLRIDREWLGSNLGSPMGSARPSSSAAHPLATSLLELQRLSGNRANPRPRTAEPRQALSGIWTCLRRKGDAVEQGSTPERFAQMYWEIDA